MQAAVFRGNGVLALETIPVPSVQNNEVLVRIMATSICGSDLHILEVPQAHIGDVGTILGHEAVGEIVQAGSGVSHLRVGDRVVIDPILYCGECAFCNTGNRNICPNAKAMGVNKHGVFAEYCAVRASNVYRVSAEVPLELAVLSEPFGCCITAVRKAEFKMGESVTILGSGPLGVMFSRIFQANGASAVYITSRSDFKTDFARKHSGDAKVITREKDPVETILAETGGLGTDVVVDTVGVLIEDAMRIVKRGGRVLLFGLNDQVTQTVKEDDIIRKGVTIHSSFATHHIFPEVIRIFESRLADVSFLLTHSFALKDIHQGIQAARSGKAMKILIRP